MLRNEASADHIDAQILRYAQDDKINTAYSTIFTTMEPIKPDSRILVDIVRTRMPFGKYRGTLISDLPVYYLEWLKKKGFPPGKMGMMLSSVYEIKINGMNSILTMVKNALNTGQIKG